MISRALQLLLEELSSAVQLSFWGPPRAAALQGVADIRAIAFERVPIPPQSLVQGQLFLDLGAAVPPL